MDTINSHTRSLLILSSQDKQTYEDAGQVEINLEVGEKNIRSIGLQSFNLLYGIQNINNNNNVAVIDDGAMLYPVKLTNGNYNIADLATEISTQLNLLGIGLFIVAVSNNVFTITAPTAITFVTNPIKSYKYDWASMIGLPKDQAIKNIIVGSIANILYTDKIFICCDEIHTNKTANDKTSNNKVTNILGIVYIGNNLPVGDGVEIIKPRNITYSYENIKYIRRRVENNLSKVTIRILDSEGLPIPKSSDGSGSVTWDLSLYCRVEEPLLIS